MSSCMYVVICENKKECGDIKSTIYRLKDEFLWIKHVAIYDTLSQVIFLKIVKVKWFADFMQTLPSNKTEKGQFCMSVKQN